MSMCCENFRPSCCRAPIESSLRDLAGDLMKIGHRILMCYGSSLPDEIREALAGNEGDFRLFEMSGAEPDPLEESVGVGAAICRHERIDALLAVGGDSVKEFAVRVADMFQKQNSSGRGVEIVFVRLP